MLLSFRVRNYRSIAKEALLSLQPVTAFHEQPENIQSCERFSALNVVAIYGANASGKSNLVKAAAFMRKTLLHSSRVGSVDELHVEPFMLDKQIAASPSLFEMTFAVGSQVYRYGFELTNTTVESEWLFVSNGGKRSVEKTLFIRQKNGFLKKNLTGMPELGSFDINTLLANALVLARLDQLNGKTAKMIMRWFSDLRVLSGSSMAGFDTYTLNELANPTHRRDVLDFIRLADRVIEDVKSESQEIDLPDIPAALRRIIVVNNPGGHAVREIVQVMRRDSTGDMISFDMGRQESEGTMKMFALAGPFTDILRNGYVAFVDELEAKLHPILTRRIIMMFNDPKINSHNAQLIFVSHDALQFKQGFGRMRRDQIWFCEKNHLGMTDLYCLSDFKNGIRVRQEEDFGKKYLEGRYGAVPEFDFQRSAGNE